MGISALIKENLYNMTADKKEYLAPNIPSQEIIAKVLDGLGEDPDYIVGIIDTSLNFKDVAKNDINVISGKLKEGIIFFEDCMYYSNGDGYQRIDYHEIRTTEFGSYKAIEKRKLEFNPAKDSFIVTLKNGKRYAFSECLRGVNYEKIIQLMKSIIDLRLQEPAKRSQQNTLLYEMHEEIKLLYMYALYNYYHYCDEKIKDQVASCIQNIFARIDLSAEKRLQARMYMAENEKRYKTGLLLKKLEYNLSDSDYELVRFSMMQDIIYLDNINSIKTEQTKGFVNSLKEYLHISTTQLELMKAAVNLHARLLDREDKAIDSVTFEKEMQRLREGAILFHMPISALFCSGGIYAPSTFHKLKRLWKEKKTVNLQRELMLKSVLENNQMTINFLIEDLNQLSIALGNEVQKSNVTYLKIEKLAEELQKLQQQNVQLEMRVEKDKIVKGLSNERFQVALEKGLFKEYLTYSSGQITLRADLSYEQMRKLGFQLERLEEKYA